MSITIPATLDEAVNSLNGLGKLLTAKEWERAAIVYAFTEDGTRGKHSSSVEVPMSCPAFAALGISGLKSDRTVRDYRKAWFDATGEHVKPGDTIKIPDLPWPSTGHTSGSRAKQFESMSPDEKAREIKTVITPDVIDNLIDDPEVRKEINDGLSRHYGEIPEGHPNTEKAALSLAVRLLKLQDQIEKLLKSVLKEGVVLTDDEKAMVIATASWSCNALEAIITGVQGNSLDDVLSQILEESA